jgi:ribonuclease D
MKEKIKTSISKEALRDLPEGAFTGNIVLIDSPDKLEANIGLIRGNKLLGFDTETRPTFRKGRVNKVALLQLSNTETAWLIRLNKTGLTKKLAQLLADPSICKVGAAILDDLRALKKMRRFTPANFIELQEYVKEHEIENFGVKKLAGLILGIRISKRQQTSNWEAPRLTPEQQRYAATDAWVCREVYSKLANKS